MKIRKVGRTVYFCKKDFYLSGLIVNYTYVCRKCNWTGRQYGRCPKCKILMLNCGKRAKIPKKHDIKGWLKFWLWYDSRVPRVHPYYVIPDDL